MYTYTQRHANKCTSHTYTHEHVCIHTTYIHTYIYTYTHTYIHNIPGKIQADVSKAIAAKQEKAQRLSQLLADHENMDETEVFAYVSCVFVWFVTYIYNSIYVLTYTEVCAYVYYVYV